MSKLTKALTAAAGNAGGDNLYVEDVFSTYLYDGNATARDITNGIDLAGEGGLVWVKSRNQAGGHVLIDTERGAGKLLRSNSTDAEADTADTQKTVNGFNDDGFSLGTDSGNWGANFNNYTYASWTFRKAEKFFDIQTWTGDGAATRQISHNLGSTPAVIIIKDLDDGTKHWWTYHQSLGNSEIVALNLTNAKFSYPAVANTDPTDTIFTVSSSVSVSNRDGHRFVAYLFASDAGGFGDDGDENIIKCGSYVGNGTYTQFQDLGFEPQWILFKNASAIDDWWIYDSMRGLVVGGPDNRLAPNLASAEAVTGSSAMTIAATGFTPNAYSTSGETYIYIAIRRPMKTPESGTEVFNTVSLGATTEPGFISNFVTDFAIHRTVNEVGSRQVSSRMTGNKYMFSDATNAEGTIGAIQWDFMNGSRVGNGTANANEIQWMFKRATGFMDVVAWSGTNLGTRVLNHNLGVQPELIIAKKRNSSDIWAVQTIDSVEDQILKLNTSDAYAATSSYLSYPTQNTSTTFKARFNLNQTGNTYIAYLFATLDGVSKVGSYTGTGNSLDIDCGFSNGARFVMIKRTDSSSDWWVWDTARGIVSGNDPTLRLNTTAAETTTADYIDPLSSGFTLTTEGNWLYGMNYPSGNYIFLAIA